MLHFIDNFEPLSLSVIRRHPTMSLVVRLLRCRICLLKREEEERRRQRERKNFHHLLRWCWWYVRQEQSERERGEKVHLNEKDEKKGGRDCFPPTTYDDLEKVKLKADFFLQKKLKKGCKGFRGTIFGLSKKYRNALYVTK